MKLPGMPRSKAIIYQLVLVLIKAHITFSMGYLNQQGIAKFNYLKRYSVRANTQFSIKDHIRVGENLMSFIKKTRSSVKIKVNKILLQQSVRESAIIPVYDIMGNYGGTKSQGLGNSGNPYAWLRARKITTTGTGISPEVCLPKLIS